ncbi:hypothetical protein PF001_g32417, partial [Phytophthora fragariae]
MLLYTALTKCNQILAKLDANALFSVRRKRNLGNDVAHTSSDVEENVVFSKRSNSFKYSRDTRRQHFTSISIASAARRGLRKHFRDSAVRFPTVAAASDVVLFADLAAMTKPEELNVDLVAELLTNLAAAAMARWRPGSASGLLVSPVLHTDVALLLTDVAVALLLTDLTVAAVATRTPGSASRLLVSTELLADVVVAPP